jgi:hypothetical protein
VKKKNEKSKSAQMAVLQRTQGELSAALAKARPLSSLRRRRRPVAAPLP